jgi:hypothetical protein
MSILLGSDHQLTTIGLSSCAVVTPSTSVNNNPIETSPVKNLRVIFSLLFTE